MNSRPVYFLARIAHSVLKSGVQCLQTSIIIRRCVLLGMVFSAVVASVACVAQFQRGPEKPVPQRKQTAYTVVDSELAAANNGFGFRLFSELLKQNSQQNVFISPASIAMALSMTYNGASNQTKDAMAAVLGYKGMSLDQINKANAALLKNMESTGSGIEVSIANSLWAADKFGFSGSFLDRNSRYYRAHVARIDLQKPSAREKMNDWVANATRGKIRDLVHEVNPLAVMFLINAVYFKGEWQERFDPSETRNADFTLPDGQKKSVPMMSRKGHYNVLWTENFNAVALPYGDGWLSMYIFVPTKGIDIAPVLEQLTSSGFGKCVKRFSDEDVSVSIPRFSVEYEARDSMKEALKNLGMGIAFGGSDGFLGMCPAGGVYIYEVAHKAFIQVDEKGSKAAAATSVQMVLKCACPERPIIVDRPFFCAIRDEKSGEILFMGYVADPISRKRIDFIHN